MSKSYWEKLKDPRWQRKRLEIMNRAGFKCECCGDEESALHIHHGYYDRRKEPWEYDDDTLRCLCESCHEMFGELLAKAHESIARLWIPKQIRVIPQLIELYEENWPNRLVPIAVPDKSIKKQQE